MWSVGVHGRSSVLQEQQRLVFSIGEQLTLDKKELQRQLVVELMTQENCRAVMISSLDNRQDLLTVKEALQQTCADNELLSRTNFAVVATTPVDCKMEEVAVRVEQALAALQLQQLDLLLLQTQSLPGSTGLYERKRIVLDAWEQMLAIQQLGLVQHIGISDLSIQDVDFLLTKYPVNPPKLWSINVELPGMASKSSDLNVPLEDVTAFAHSHGIDLAVRFPFDCLETLEPPDLLDNWKLLTQSIADKYRELSVKFLVTHEGTTASYHLNSHSVRKTTVMQTPLQIIVRYLLQKGLVVIPQGYDDLQYDDKDSRAHKHALGEIFGPLAHSFSALHPSCSPHKIYSSLLTRNDLTAIDRTLPFLASSPLPTPHTPINTTGTSRAGSRHDRQRNLPTAFSRPSTAE